MRVDGWERLLWQAIEDARNKPFRWGAHDCATFAFDTRLALTGEDAAKAWRGRYRTARGAHMVLRRRLKAASHEEAATAILGAPLATIWLAQRGDIVLRGDSFGVCVGAEAAFLSPEGLVFWPLEPADKAWRV
jgi:hypothetical protein